MEFKIEINKSKQGLTIHKVSEDGVLSRAFSKTRFNSDTMDIEVNPDFELEIAEWTGKTNFLKGIDI